jgi:hypothetical protein
MPTRLLELRGSAPTNQVAASKCSTEDPEPSTIEAFRNQQGAEAFGDACGTGVIETF